MAIRIAALGLVLFFVKNGFNLFNFEKSGSEQLKNVLLLLATCHIICIPFTNLLTERLVTGPRNPARVWLKTRLCLSENLRGRLKVDSSLQRVAPILEKLVALMLLNLKATVYSVIGQASKSCGKGKICQLSKKMLDFRLKFDHKLLI